MKTKLWLYIGFFVLFTFVYSQIAFPVSARVKSISIKHAGSAESLPVFKAIQNSTAAAQNTTFEYFIKDAAINDFKDHYFVEYEIDVESTSVIPVDILGSRITVDDEYKSRVVVRLAEPYAKEVSAAKASNKRFKLLVNTKGMSTEEILAMIKKIGIHVSWKAMPRWERQNKVHLPEGTLLIDE